jgi:hypothetical protein
MPDTPEPQSVVDAAAQAAAAGDYVSAETLLREAARLQELSLGPLHPDLANTLNSLGIVCEMTGKPVDAERCFRQAWAIASAALPPDHPFVTTSRKNLEEFCVARGLAIDSLEPPPSAVAAEPAVPRPLQPSSHAVSRPVVPRNRSRFFAIGGLVAGGLLVAFMAATTWFGTHDENGRSPGSPTAEPAERPAAGPPPPVESIHGSGPTETAADRSGPADAEPRAGGATPSTPGGPPTTQPPAEPPATLASPATLEHRATPPAARQPMVVAARLCGDLPAAERHDPSGDWQCVPPKLPMGSGPVFFYTRITSPTAAAVEHRWYRGDHLHQVVPLRIGANAGRGYRTYSRTTVDNRSRGEWRVEVRTGAGILLHEERVEVR